MNTNKVFTQRVNNYFGDLADDFLKLLEAKPTKAFFLNTLKANKEDILKLIDFDYKKSGFNENCYIHDNDNIGKTIVNELGLIYPQDSESSYSSSLIDDIKPELIVDLASAPGGKSINIVNRFKDDTLICNDVSFKRAQILSSNFERLGIDNSIITSVDCKVLSKQLAGNADLVILDAPCSGEGMIRKYNEILDDYSEANILSLAKIQSELLDNAYTCLKENGYILYSTCTYAPEEDEQQIENLLNRYPDLQLIELKSKYNYSKLKGTVKLCPLNGTEGQFIAFIKKTSNTNTNKLKYLKTVKNKQIDDFIKANLDIDNYYLYQVKDTYYLSLKPLYELKSNVLRYGIYLGEINKNHYEPTHNMYRANSLFKYFKYRYELNDSEYKDYIKGLEIKTNLKNAYYLLTYKTYPLGYGKVSNGVIKNKYPKGLRHNDII